MAEILILEAEAVEAASRQASLFATLYVSFLMLPFCSSFKKYNIWISLYNLATNVLSNIQQNIRNPESSVLSSNDVKTHMYNF